MDLLCVMSWRSRCLSYPRRSHPPLAVRCHVNAAGWFSEELMRNIRKRFGIPRNGDQGFSTLELLIVVSISLIMAALAIPGYNTIRRTLRISGDGRDLNGSINEAKLEAASGFTRARLYADITANTFHIETWNKTANGG